MTENVKVVVLPEAMESAYNMAFDRFEEVEVNDCCGEAAYDLSFFKETAEFANNVHPTIRSMSGYEDSGYGTYTVENRTVVVRDPDDRPMDGELMNCTYVESDLIEAYDCGAFDAMEGNERYDSLEN